MSDMWEPADALDEALYDVWCAALDARAMLDEPSMLDRSEEERERAYLNKQRHHMEHARATIVALQEQK